MDRIWFLTGCSSGFGRLLAERLFAAGESVVVTARSAQALYDLGRSDESRILRLPLDVRDSGQIRECVSQAIERFGRIDVLVNNAGYAYFGTTEEGEMEQVREMFETNLFGLIAVTQAVLPSMRERRHGTIVNVSSIAGMISTPRGGFYQATKWGVEAISASLHLEVEKFGIRVVVIEPGAYDTDFGSRSVRLASAESDPASPYAELRERWKRNVQKYLFPHRQNPAEVVDDIIDAVDAGLPFVRLPVGSDAHRLVARLDEMKRGPFTEWMRGAMNAE